MTTAFPKPIKKAKPVKWLKRKPKKPQRKKRVKLPTLRKLISEADRVFSLFIRQRDRKCVLCGSTKNLTNGHLIKRGKKAVRWDEKNCSTLCRICNYKDNFEHDIYVTYFLTKYGVEEYTRIVGHSRGIFKPSRGMLEEIIKKYSPYDIPKKRRSTKTQDSNG